MTNNKQQTAVEWFHQKTWDLKIQLEKGEISIGEYANTYSTLYEQAKEKYEHEMCEFAAEYAQYELQQNKPGIKGAMVSMCAWTFFKNRRK
jgi:hypothetical protein